MEYRALLKAWPSCPLAEERDSHMASCCAGPVQSALGMKFSLRHWFGHLIPMLIQKIIFDFLQIRCPEFWV